jgi:hypothetical protein
MNLGRISYSDADAIDRAIQHNSVQRPERRHQFRVVRPEPEIPKPIGAVCPGCNLRRTPKEFQGFGVVHETCSNCRGKAKP